MGLRATAGEGVGGFDFANAVVVAVSDGNVVEATSVSE